MFETGIPERFSFRRFIVAAPVLILIVVVMLVILDLIIGAILQPDPTFLPLNPAAVAITIVLNLVPAAIVYALIGRFTKRPWTNWYVVSIICFLLTLIPDFMLFLPNDAPMFPVVTTPYILALILFHIVGAGIFIPLLPRWSAPTG